ncbi:MAG TPA: phage major capsid protein [Candidatus Limnocylindrales bacterium]|nr:phage major capsid protein [Candidatus Limnocylindrales bacterium]
MAELNQIEVATKRFIRNTPKLVDMVFQEGPLVAYAKQNVRTDYDGGRYIGENFYYNGLIGGAYAKGKTFDITQPQVEQQLQFDPKFFEVDVTLYKEDIQVINKGPNAAFKLIESRMTNAYMTIGAQMEIGMFLPGTGAGYTANFNGLTEALNAGTTTGWNATAYTTYGTITRGGATGTVLNSLPVNAAGDITYPTMEETYGACSFGPGKEPNVGLTTYLGYSYIKEKFQTQQRFQNIQDPKIGFNGLQFNEATIMRSRYAPGSYISGSGDPIAVSFLNQTSLGAITAYPTVTAETLWWLNCRKPYFNFYISDDPEYGLGFTGFKPAQANTVVAGQVLFSGAVTFAPRYHKQVYGITG